MKRSLKAACIAAVMLISTAFALVGCERLPPPPIKSNYPFLTENLTEQKLNVNQHINILSTAVGEYIEDLMTKSSGLLDYDVSETVDVSDVPFTISLRLRFDQNATDENGDNDTLELGVEIKNGDGAVITLGVKKGAFFAEKPDGNGGVARFENPSSLLSKLFRFPLGTTDSLVKELSKILLYVTFIGDSTRYGTKMVGGFEISELTLSTSLFSTLSSLTKAIRYLEVDSINTNYPTNTGNPVTDDTNKEKRKEEIEKLDYLLNGLTQFLFAKNYDKIFELPTVYLNLNIIMKDKLATKIGISVSKEPKFSKAAFAA